MVVKTINLSSNNPTPPEKCELLDFFVSELQSENIADKVKTLKRIKYIAHVLGPERTREELLPVLIEMMENCDEEVSYTLCEQFVTITDFLGPPTKALSCVVEPLKKLASSEETIVCDKAVEELTTLVKRAKLLDCSRAFIKDNIVNVVSFLKHGNGFLARIAAAQLIVNLYKFTDEEDQKLFHKYFIELCHDEVQIVRKSSVDKLQSLLESVDPEMIEELYVPLMSKLWEENESDHIRCSIICAIESILKKSSPKSVEHILSLIKVASNYPSWKIRLALAKNIATLMNVLGEEHIENTMSIYILLIKDADSRVVGMALQSFEHCVGMISKAKEKSQYGEFTQILESMIHDANASIREALASIIYVIAQVYGSERYAELLPIVDKLMKDECYVVRLKTIRHFGELCKLWGVQVFFSSFIQGFSCLLNDSQWYLREAIIEQIPIIAKLLTAEEFKNTLESLYIEAFHDIVYAVREAAVKNIKSLGEVFGSEWTFNVLFSQIKEKYEKVQIPILDEGIATPVGFQDSIVSVSNNNKNNNHSHSTSELKMARLPRQSSFRIRITILHTIPHFLNICRSSILVEEVSTIIEKALQDSVSNVRLACIRILQKLHRQPRLIDVHSFLPLLMNLVETEKDVDVIYFCEQLINDLKPLSVETTAS